MARNRRKKAETKSEELPMRTFRLLRGKHINGGKTYKKGDLIHTTADLARFNCGPGSMRYQEINPVEEVAPAQSETPAPSPQEENSNTDYTLEELRIIADDEEVDITGLTTKEEIVKAMADHQKANQV